VIGYAVGLGNVWRFPFLVFKHGGAPFLIPFFIMLFMVGIPMFFLETSIGQFSGLSPTHVFEHMVPLFKGLGYAAIIINCFVGFYYNVVIAYCMYYFAFSLRSELLWAKCGPERDCFQRKNLSGNCLLEKEEFYRQNSKKF
jgi:SNF family Na+-dependent transporter